MANRTCTIDGCDRKHNARGLCVTHYSRWMRGIDLDTPVATRNPGQLCRVQDCDRPTKCLGLCKLHYSRMARNGTIEPKFIRDDPERRFWSTVDKTPTCWIWTGRINHDGYGQFSVMANGKRRFSGAHRWAWEFSVGPIPDGMQIDHLCYIPACVNPAHLEVVTGAENLRRMHERRRQCR